MMTFTVKMRNPKNHMEEFYSTEDNDRKDLQLSLDFWERDAGYIILEEIPLDEPLHVTYQTIPTPDDDGQYTPDYAALISAASCPEEADYIHSVEASGMRFAYNMVYVTRQACGHYEIFQTPHNMHYPLKDNLDLARKTAAERKCTTCICGW